MTNPVQAVIGSWVASGANTITLQPNTAGGSQPAGGTNNGIVVMFNFYTATNTMASVADNQSPSNTYVKLYGLADNQSQVEISMWYCANPTINVANYSVTGTMTSTLSGSDHCLVRLIEMTGVTGTDVGNSIATGNIAGPTTVTNGSANSQANEFVIALCAVSYNGTNPTLSAASSGYTNMGTDNGFLNYVQSNCSYKTLSATETSSASWTYAVTGSSAAIIQTFKVGSTYNGINQLDYSTTSGANSITSTGASGTGYLTVATGQLLVGYVYSQNIPSCSFSDSLSNTWSPYNSSFAATNGNVGVGGFWCVVTNPGNAYFTATASGICSAIAVDQFQINNGGSGFFIAGSGQYVSSIPSGTNNATTGNINCGASNAIGSAFCFDPACTASPAAGTGFSGTNAVWMVQQGGTHAPAKPENGLVIGTQALTFSTNNPGDAVYTLGAAFSLQPYVVPIVLPVGPMPRRKFILP